MPKSIQKIRFSFEETGLTHFGGMWLIQSFCKLLGFRQRLQDYVRCPKRNNFYSSTEFILALLYSIIMGLRRINKTDILQYNGSFLKMLGLKRFPDQSTIRRFLKRLPPDTIRQLVRLHDSLRAHLFPFPHPRHGLIFDLDSTVIVIYGEQQKGAVGYNPKKPGRRSYHPLLCFEANFQEFWHGSLRPGNTVAMTGAIPFIKRCLEKVPSTIGRSRIRFRMDSGFYSRRIVGYLDAMGCGYVIVAKEYKPVKRAACTCRFQALNNGWEAGEFREKIHFQDKKEHRFVVVRRPIPSDEEEDRQLTLFKHQKYAYHVFVTNLPLSPWRVYLFYSPRATIEKNIRELMYDYPLGKIPTEDWTANVAFFQLVLFAANIAHWFKRLCLPDEYHAATLDTIRTDFLVLPARLTRVQGKNIVKLPGDYHYRKEFLQAFKTIEGLRLPGNFRICKRSDRSLSMKNRRK
jgi:hypothetical protein